MKEAIDIASVGNSAEKENFANRKLIRPTLPRVENHGNHSPMQQSGERRERLDRHERVERGDRGDRGERGERGERQPDRHHLR